MKLMTSLIFAVLLSLTLAVGVSAEDTVVTIGNTGGIVTDKNVEAACAAAGVTAQTPFSIVFAPETVVIDDYALLGIAGVQKITIPASVIKIGAGAFALCGNCTAFYFEGDLPSVSDFAFYGVAKNWTLYLPQDNTTWTPQLQTHTLGATQIVGWNPATGEILASIPFATPTPRPTLPPPSPTAPPTPTPKPKTVTVGHTGGVVSSANVAAAYAKVSGQVRVTVAKGAKSIAPGAFRNDDSLVSVTLPKGLTTVGQGAFGGCRNLESVSLPKTLKTIDTQAFYHCYKLKTVTIPAQVTRIGDAPFSSDACLQTIRVAKKNKAYKSVNGVLFTKNGKMLVQYPAGKKGTAYTVPTKTKIIGEAAFYEANSLKTIKLPQKLTTIGNYAFCGVGFVSLTIPRSVTEIHQGAFQTCYSLKTLTFAGKKPTFGSVVFSGLSQLTFHVPKKDATWNGVTASSFGIKAIER